MNDPIIDGEDAQRVLNSRAFAEAFADMRNQVLEEFGKCPVRDAEGLQYLSLTLKAIDGLKTRLERRISTGKLAAIQIERREKESKLRQFLKVA